MKLEVEKDRLEINKIIENCLPLMIKNKNMIQECADCIIVYFIEKLDNQQKKDDEDLHVSHLGTRSTEEEDNTMKCKTDVVENHVDIDTLSLTAIDGNRNPQECSGKANVAKKEDTSIKALPVDSKSKVVILDDNVLSLSCYAEDYPENFKAMTEAKQDDKDN